MKKFLAIAAIATVLVSCEDKKTEETVAKDTMNIVTTPEPVVPDTAQVITTTTTETTVDTVKKDGDKK